jgi:hypothetical protein
MEINNKPIERRMSVVVRQGLLKKAAEEKEL